jgi:lipoprotein-anchoring transpeptidase ErfK/SrfK
MSINYPGYGIHGTWDKESLGKQSSAGCIRLQNSDIEELFTIIPLHTKVKIID